MDERFIENERFIELDRVEKVFDVRRKTGFLRRERREVRARGLDLLHRATR